MLRQNRKRAKRTGKALRQSGLWPRHEPFKDIATDMLTDLRHLCDAKGLDFAALDRLACMHYSDEIAPPPSLIERDSLGK